MITAISTIRHNGNVYTEGQEIPGLTTEQAAQLVFAGAATGQATEQEPAGAATEQEPADTKKPNGGAKG
jgi:hypothetical protein